MMTKRFDGGCDCESEGEQSSSFIARKLFESRTIVICSDINQKVAKDFCEKILALSAVSDADIRVILHSQGGHVESGDTIHDMIKCAKPRVKIIGTGWVASAGVLIYLAASKENRLSLPNTRFMIHQPAGGVGGSASDMEIEANEIVKMRQRINQIIAQQTGQPLDKVSKDTDRNYWLSPEEAQQYGIVGRVVKSLNEV
jgi:ATP-dependent Clp protease protease subunit